MNFVIAYIRRQFPNTPNIDTNTALELTKENDNVLLLDVRRPDEFGISRIPGAKNVHFRCSDEELKEALNETNENTKIVSYCSLGYRSAIITNRIREMSEKDSNVKVRTDNVFNLEGSIFKWANENKPLTDSANETTRYDFYVKLHKYIRISFCNVFFLFFRFVHPFSYMFGFLGLNFNRWKWSE